MKWTFRRTGIAGGTVPVLLALSFVLSTRAAEHDIYITDEGFYPGYLVVQVGDTVTWWNVDTEYEDYHSTTCAAYPWNSPRLYYQDRAYLTLTRSGTFNYECVFCEFAGTIVVNPALGTPLLTASSILANGHFQFTVTNLLIGRSNVVEMSTNLTTWFRIHTNDASGYSYTFTDPTVASGQRFYRVLVLP